MIAKLGLCAALALGLGACVPAAPPGYLVAPADPSIPTQAPRYAAVTGTVKRFGVVSPKDWREMNKAVAPQERQPSAEDARRGR